MSASIQLGKDARTAFHNNHSAMQTQQTQCTSATTHMLLAIVTPWPTDNTVPVSLPLVRMPSSSAFVRCLQQHAHVSSEETYTE